MTQSAVSQPGRPAGRYVVGTRGSPLAMAQANEFARRMAQAHGWAPEQLDIQAIKTSGDQIQDRPLSEAGGKGLFTRELDIEQAAGRIDFAVHSAKDLPTVLPEGIVIAGFLPREDVRDALIARDVTRIEDLPQGAIVGSASLRRQAMLRRLRPDLDIVLLRGNVARRLSKVTSGEIAATLLAIAGLNRLGMAEVATTILPVEQFLPAVGQGAIAVTVRAGDAAAMAAVAPILCRDTGIALEAERAMLTVLDGSCRTPIAGHATVTDGSVHLRGLLLSPDGSASAGDEITGPVSDAAALGSELGRRLRVRAPHGIYA
jgi:hydroxymethylbilane synthase